MAELRLVVTELEDSNQTADAILQAGRHVLHEAAKKFEESDVVWTGQEVAEGLRQYATTLRVNTISNAVDNVFEECG